MVKKVLIGMFVALLSFGFAGFSWAAMLTGQVMKIDGSTYVIKDNSGKEQLIQVNESTTKDGKIKEGARVEVEVDDVTGFAKSIKVKGT